MAEAILAGVVKSLVQSLTSYAKDQLVLAWELEEQLEKLKGTMGTISSLFQDFEAKPGRNISHVDQDWLNKLQDAVYDADDLFDEILTRAERKRLMGGNSFIKEVKLFLSASNQVFTSRKLTNRVKTIRERLDGICEDHRKFGNAIQPMVMVVEKESNILHMQGQSSYNVVYTHDKVVGRENEKDEIISMLFDSSIKETVSVIPIVGVGGLGKTTLALHVFNDEQVKQNFDLMLWIDVPRNFELKEIMERIVKVAGEDPINCDLEQLKIRFSRCVNGKKYMLVLDDVWEENPLKWQDLKAFLMLSPALGSKILVTTRSLIVGKIMGTVPSYQMEPLSINDSWNLFEKIAFHGNGCHESSLEELGRDILKMCQNVPLLIRAVAGVLAMKDFNLWTSFKDDELSNFAFYGEDFNVMPVLKLSYDYLKPTKLKTCFSYFSMFPRGHVFDKKRLVILWIAQGFVDPLHKCQSLEHAGEEYLAILLDRSLLQDVEGDESGSSCKLHDLMYDLSCYVAEGQCKMLSPMQSNGVGGSVRHISLGYQVDSSWKVPGTMQSVKRLRTFFITPACNPTMSGSFYDNLISSFCSLRTLDLKGIRIDNLPKSIGNLIHLRYLDLSGNTFEKLPSSIGLLQNLQYLDVFDCYWLHSIPRDIKNLVNLRHLHLDRKDSWHRSCADYYPSGIGNMTNLQTLNVFVVPRVPVTKRMFSNTYAHLGELSSTNNLKGKLSIFIEGSYPNMAIDARKANLKGKKDLKYLRLNWARDDYYEEDEMVLENLQPHSQILELEIYGYQGMTLPEWMGTNQLAAFLPHLASITIKNCKRIQHIPSFARLPNLKSICFFGVPRVEYLESSVDALYEGGSSSSSFLSIFFPSLTRIEICGMRSLKSWVRYGEENMSFPCASFVKIEDCPVLEAMPRCPNAKHVSLRGMSEKLQMSYSYPNLEIIEVDSVEYLISLPREFLLHKVSQLIFDGGLEEREMELTRLGEGLEGMTSLKSLEFIGCAGLKSLFGMPVQLSTLERLEFQSCDNIKWASDETINAWKVLKNLRFLTFYGLRELEVLPRGIQCITTLQSLELRRCWSLREIPDWIGELCSLERLEVVSCPELASLPQEMRNLTKLKVFMIDSCYMLARRCRRETGEDWHKIPDTAEVIITGVTL